MQNRPFNLPRFAAAALVFVAAASSSALSSFAQETPPVPAAPATPVSPAVPDPTAAPAAPAASNTQADAQKKEFVEWVKKLNEARKADTEADRKRIDDMVNALKRNNMAVRSYGYATSLFGGVRLPSQTISVDLKNVSARDALAKVLGEAKLDYVINDDFPQNTKLSLSVSGVQVSTALDLITQSAGVRWAVEKRDNKIIVRVGKNVVQSNVFGLAYASPNALSNLFGPATLGTPAPLFKMNVAQLPPAKVTLDLRNASAKDALLSLLEKHQIVCEIADDFPKDAKITLAIEDADLSTVLDQITRSVGVRWAVDKKDDKVVVRVGKNVVSNSDHFLNFSGGKNNKSDSVLPVPTTDPRVNMTRIFTTDSAAPVIYQYQTSEQRSTFTCPRCGKKTTVVQKSSGSGGAHDNWHYCPYCGKKVAVQSANLAAPLWQTESDNTTAFGTGENQLPSFFFPALPMYDSALSDDPAQFERF